jgi:GTPase SAR1 family protein
MKHFLVVMNRQMKYQVIKSINIAEKKEVFLLFELDLRELSQKITRYLKTSQRTLSLPVGEVMLNRKEKL